MTEKEIETIRALRDRGFAVAIFTPEELEGVRPSSVEDRMIEKGWDVIECLKRPVGTGG